MTDLGQFYNIYFGEDGLKVNGVLGDIKVAIPKPSQRDKAAVEALIELGARIQMIRLRRAKKEVKEVMDYGKELGVR